jgi:serine/threonine-protein kinase
MSEDLAAELRGFGPGSRVAGYLLEEQIGQGGMAVVFRALDESLNRPVALKILAPAIAADEAFRHRFIRESQAAAAVDDPHIIPVYQAGEVGHVLFIAMRLVRGGDVTTLVRREGPLTPKRVAAIVSPIASSLDAAHEAGLVHRDVKPANILLDIRQGRPDHVYLSDFGLSKSALGVSGITATGQFLGTPNYIAPEQISGKGVDGRADQYSLAATAFELLCGTPPFRGEQPMAVVYAHLSEPPPTLTSRPTGSAAVRNSPMRWAGRWESRVTTPGPNSPAMSVRRIRRPRPSSSHDPTPLTRRGPAPARVTAPAAAPKDRPRRQPGSRRSQRRSPRRDLLRNPPRSPLRCSRNQLQRVLTPALISSPRPISRLAEAGAG